MTTFSEKSNAGRRWSATTRAIAVAAFGLFQITNRRNFDGVWACLMSLEWHLLTVFLRLLSTLFWPLAGIKGLMWLAMPTLGLRMGSKAPLRRKFYRMSRMARVVSKLDDRGFQLIWR